MTDTEINKAIAEAVGGTQLYAVKKSGMFYRPNSRGYTDSLLEAGKYSLADAKAELVRGEPMRIVPIPQKNYAGCLNAMHEAEMWLRGTVEQYHNDPKVQHRWDSYTNRVLKYCGVSAAAIHRAEIFLKELNLWKD